MLAFGKLIVLAVVLNAIATDANGARRRRRRQTMLNQQQPTNLSPVVNSFNQLPLPPNAQMSNGQGQPGPPPSGQNDMGLGKNAFGGPGQAGRQYYPQQSQQGYGSVQGLNYPYAGAGVGSYQYGMGQYGQSGQGFGQSSGYYNQYPGSNSFYGGSNSGSSYNRPGYSSNYYPSSGGNNYGSYGGGGYGGYGGGGYWNHGHRASVNKMAVLLSSFLPFLICAVVA